jgi:hypothetical protein
MGTDNCVMVVKDEHDVRDHRALTSVMHRLPAVSFVSIEAYFSLDRASRFPL